MLGCEFGTVILAINKDEAATISLKKDWKLLARELEIKKIDVMELEEEMLLGKKRLLDTIEAILELWRSQKANKATLRSLITACSNIELKDVADVLETIQYGNLR